MASYIVGLTGGIGSGKTTVANIFAELGIDIIDADLLAREVVAPGSSALTEIARHFGNEFIDAEGQLDRARLRQRIFANEQDKLWLNALLHPKIRQRIIAELASAQSPYAILVAPLLIENGLHTSCDRVLVVDVQEQTQIARTMARDHNSPAQVQNIIASQIARNERLALADDIIDNEQSNMAALRQQVEKLQQKYLKLSQC